MISIPNISECMTRSPHTIGEDIKLSEATHRMHEFEIRHLPVLKGGKLVGVVTDRDVKLALSVHPQATDLVVGDIMTEDAYAVTPDTPVDRAAEEMFRHKYGCTIVTEKDGKTIGVFTANDALRVLTAVLRGNPASAYSHASRGPEAVKHAARG